MIFKRANVALIRIISFALFYSSVILVCYTYAVHSAVIIRGASEDGGLLQGVAAMAGDEAAHAVDNPLAVDVAVEGATRVTL